MSAKVGLYTFTRIGQGSREKAIITGFIEALYFTYPEELGDAMLSPRAQSTIETLAIRFCADNSGVLDALYCHGYDMETIGGDLFFSLNGDGTGLWDHEETIMLDDWIERVYRAETGRSIYSIDPYVGDDGLIYFAGLSIFQTGLAT